jgi:hypothetical protein
MMAALSAALVLVAGVPEDAGTPTTGTGGTPAATQPRSPFADTPAEAFADGAAGIVLPPAWAVPDGYLLYYEGTARAVAVEDVAEALEDLRQALIAARLNKTTLVHHDPDPFIRNLTRGAWDTWYDPYFRGGPWNDFWDSPEFANLATMLANGTGLAAEPRVAGRITYEPSTEPDPVRRRPYAVLRFVTRFVWVYAFVKPAGLVVIRDVVSWHVPTDDRLVDWYINQGLHVSSWEARAWGAECEAYEEGLVRPREGVAITEAVFDLDREPAGGCRPG